MEWQVCLDLIFGFKIWHFKYNKTTIPKTFEMKINETHVWLIAFPLKCDWMRFMFGWLYFIWDYIIIFYSRSHGDRVFKIRLNMRLASAMSKCTSQLNIILIPFQMRLLTFCLKCEIHIYPTFHYLVWYLGIEIVIPFRIINSTLDGIVIPPHKIEKY